MEHPSETDRENGSIIFFVVLMDGVKVMRDVNMPDLVGKECSSALSPHDAQRTVLALPDGRQITLLFCLVL